ncbi:MAG: RecQ family ATP-dependent DNA helicase [Cyanosarcina radialis HA8281-LM2]|jgi:ATP-dependent DNA helicase RecQ|nr:RecQ family ATP-dependent DNA helicase [Cyanosarcina radialis HA8281-LM2]
MTFAETRSWNEVRAAFQKIWGYEDFRPPQGEIVRSLLENRDALIVMPTGGGKSICFQLPALLQTGLTLVISPLVALMENQVAELRQKKLPAALLHSELPSSDRSQTLKALEKQQLRLLYLSPETLLSKPVWERLSQPQMRINGLILDEAHCLVQWGETFRPAYRRLGAVRSTLLESKPPGTKIAIAAFTATADPAAQKTIREVLQLQQPDVFLLNPYRPNLNLKVQTIWTPRGRRQQLLKFIGSKPKQAGLVYVRTRRDSEELTQFLLERGYTTAAYHAGLSPEKRRAIEASWSSGATPFVICTCAFGMGINKSNVRWIVHFQPAFLLSEYVQEIGRAGRDGNSAEALMLVSEPTGWLDPADKQRQQFFHSQELKQRQMARQLIDRISQQGHIDTVARQFPQGAIALSLLHASGQVQWQDPFHYQIDRSAVSQSASQASAIEQMNQYLRTKNCRWKFILEAFGFSREAASLKGGCGHCDRCRPPKQRLT